jgi:hypothetical protein
VPAAAPEGDTTRDASPTPPAWLVVVDEAEVYELKRWDE